MAEESGEFMVINAPEFLDPLMTGPLMVPSEASEDFLPQEANKVMLIRIGGVSIIRKIKDTSSGASFRTVP